MLSVKEINALIKLIKAKKELRNSDHVLIGKLITLKAGTQKVASAGR